MMKKTYNKPVVEVLEECAEGVFAASGALTPEEEATTVPAQETRCRFDEKDFSRGRESCQWCCATNGQSDSKPAGADAKDKIPQDQMKCIDNMKEK